MKSEDELKMEANEEDEQKKRAGEEVKKGKHCPSIVRRCPSRDFHPPRVYPQPSSSLDNLPFSFCLS